MDDRLVHHRVDDTLKTLGIVQRGGFYLLQGYYKDKGKIGCETDSLSVMKKVLSQCMLVSAKIDKIILESSAKENITATLKRSGDREWWYDIEYDSEE